jgi:hypothetical protein
VLQLDLNYAHAVTEATELHGELRQHRARQLPGPYMRVPIADYGARAPVPRLPIGEEAFFIGTPRVGTRSTSPPRSLALTDREDEAPVHSAAIQDAEDQADWYAEDAPSKRRKRSPVSSPGSVEHPDQRRQPRHFRDLLSGGQEVRQVSPGAPNPQLSLSQSDESDTEDERKRRRLDPPEALPALEDTPPSIEDADDATGPPPPEQQALPFQEDIGERELAPRSLSRTPSEQQLSGGRQRRRSRSARAERSASPTETLRRRESATTPSASPRRAEVVALRARSVSPRGQEANSRRARPGRGPGRGRPSDGNFPSEREHGPPRASTRSPRREGA